LPVCGLGGAMIQTEVVPAGRFQPFVAEDFFYVSYRASIE
jgi:hypothetical protein